MSKPILTRAQRRAVREHGASGMVITKTDARKLRRHGMTDIEGQLTAAGRVVRQLLKQLHETSLDLIDAEDEIEEIEAKR
jgi:membrane-bound lytic murein transglycosylase MltF